MESIDVALENPGERPKVLLNFDGLFVSHFEGGTYQLGAIPAAEHQFSIVVNEFQLEGRPEDDIRVLISTSQISGINIIPPNRRWTFRIEQAGPAPAPARPFYSGTIPNRLDPPLDDDGPEAKDLRWTLSLDDGMDFPEHGDMTPVNGLLKPIISFKNGVFYNRGLIRRPTIFRKREGHERENLGVISESFRANLEDINVGGRILLRDQGGREILNLALKDRGSYSILFRNAPAHEHPSSPGTPSHFPLFYSVFVPGYERYDLTTLSDGFPGFPSTEMPAGGRGAPAPFRCGPARVETPLN